MYLLTSLKLLSRHSTFPVLLLNAVGRSPLSVLNDCDKSSLLLNSFGLFCEARKKEKNVHQTFLVLDSTMEVSKSSAPDTGPMYLLTSLKLLSTHSTFPILLLNALRRLPLGVLSDCDKSFLLLKSFVIVVGA